MTQENQIEILAQGKYFEMLKVAGWEFIKPKCFTGVVLIVPITDDNKLVLIEQYRRPVDSVVVELPAGLVGDEPHHGQESYEVAAQRELIEETGYRAKKIEIIADGAPSPGSNSVILTFLKATELEKVAAGGGVDNENIVVTEVEFDKIGEHLEKCKQQGKIIDLKVYAGLCMIGKTL